MPLDPKYVAEDILTALQRYGEQTQRGVLRAVPGAALTVVEVLAKLVEDGRVVQRPGKRKSIVYDLAPVKDPDPEPPVHMEVPDPKWRETLVSVPTTGWNLPRKAPSVTPEAVNIGFDTQVWADKSEAVPEPAQDVMSCQRFVDGAPCGARVTGTGVWCAKCEQNVRAQLGLGG